MNDSPLEGETEQNDYAESSDEKSSEESDDAESRMVTERGGIRRGFGRRRGRGGGRGQGRGRGRGRGQGSGRGRGRGRGGGRGCRQTNGNENGGRKKADGNPNWKVLNSLYTNKNAGVEFLEYTGPSRTAILPETPLQFLELFFTPEVFKQLADQTNLYYQYSRDTSRKPLPPFKETTTSEMMAFLGISIAMGIARLPSYDDYWKAGILNMPWFASIMTRKRFRELSRYFHLADNKKSVEKGHPDYSKLFKLGGLDEKLSALFSRMYHPSRNLSIDEQMVGMKSRLSFIQYMPKKPKKFGVKVWACCDAETAYCLKFQIYTGASDNGSENGLSHRVVFDLMKDYLDKGYNLFVDNFYTSLRPVQNLQARKTFVCGTIRANRGEFPKEFKDAKLAAGQSVYLEMDGIVAVHWKDKRNVFVMSSFHGNEETTVHRNRGDIIKPLMIQSYNNNLGGVDRCDQYLSYYGLNRKSLKWWKKVFFRLLDMAIVNSMLLFFKKNPQLQKKKNASKKFREMLVYEMVQPFLYEQADNLTQPAGRPSLEPKTKSKVDVLDSTRLTGKHYASKRNPRRKCCVCAYKRDPNTGKRSNKRTVNYCAKCEKYVCERCFKDFHSKSKI